YSLSFVLLPLQPRSRLFPYTTLFRSFKARAGTTWEPGDNSPSTGARGPFHSCDRSRRGGHGLRRVRDGALQSAAGAITRVEGASDRKSTRLNSSHRTISYAVCCLKKK